MRRNTTRSASRFRHYISSPKSNMPASELFISKGTIEHSSNCEFLLKIYHFLSFWNSLSSTKLTYTQTLSAQIYALTLVLTRDVSENTLPFVSQSINNFSDNDISQTHDWECPTLFPHVLLGPGDPYPLADFGPRSPIRGGSKSAGTPGPNILMLGWYAMQVPMILRAEWPT